TTSTKAPNISATPEHPVPDMIYEKKYILDLLAEIGMINCKPGDTPMMVNQKLFMEKKAKLADQNRYQRLVRKLIYLSHTRPDIAHAVGVVTHMYAALRIVKYLKGTAGHGVLFRSNGHLNIQMYTDRDKGNRQSTSGYFSLVGGNLVTWRSKKQKVVSLLSAEAEFRGKDGTAALFVTAGGSGAATLLTTTGGGGGAATFLARAGGGGGGAVTLLKRVEGGAAAAATLLTTAAGGLGRGTSGDVDKRGGVWEMGLGIEGGGLDDDSLATM
nr:putative reverse transcriptase, RNA-dependent DNA polymerase [Tanacetum cinerariifolium]